MKQSRRKFLKDLGLLAAGQAPLMAGLASITTQALAASTQKDSDFNFVLFRVIGGMDSVLGIHPYLEQSAYAEEDLFLDYNPHVEVMKNVGGTKISLGPSASSLAPFVDQMAVVRGIYMGASDVGHPSAIQYISSARPAESTPHLAAHIGSQLWDQSRFVMTNSALQRGTIAPFPVNLTQTLKKIKSVSDFATRSSLNLYRDPNLAVNRYLNLIEQKSKLKVFTDILSAQPSSTEIFDETVVLASLTAGLTRVAQIDLIDQAHDLDTHSSHTAHKGFQKMRWDRIANFLQGLKDHQLLEKTLVVVVTEFNRSPGKNFNQGKDHNYTDNAVALFGRNINGGETIGDRKLYVRKDLEPAFWAGSFINYKTGELAGLDTMEALGKMDQIRLPEHLDLIRPTDFWATVANSIAPDVIKFLATESKIVPGLFKS